MGKEERCACSELMRLKSGSIRVSRKDRRWWSESGDFRDGQLLVMARSLGVGCCGEHGGRVQLQMRRRSRH